MVGVAGYEGLESVAEVGVLFGEHEGDAVAQGLAGGAEVVGQDVVEGLAEELLHVGQADSCLGIAAVQHQSYFVLIIAQHLQCVHTNFHIFYGRDEVDDAEECDDGGEVEYGEVQCAEHRGHIDEDVVVLGLEFAYGAHGVVVMDVVASSRALGAASTEKETSTF